MCGINGIVNSSKHLDINLKTQISSMNDLIIHRGPDEDGFYFNKNHDYEIAMSMRRLSIIDISGGNQPIYNNDKSIIIVFNGEIYNYAILRKELKKNKIKFNTKSDTEVVLRIYEYYGIKRN